MSFAPSVERARAEGVRVRRQEYPSGVAGVKMSLEAIAQHIREGGADTQVQGWAMDQLLAAGINGRGGTDSARQKMVVLLDAVRKNTVYTPDPPGTELVKSAAAMLCLRPNLCIRGGDCFPEGTLILRDNHALVPIEEIRVGDRIWGRDAWTTVQNVWAKGELSVDAIEMNNGSTVFLTKDHKVYAGRCKHGKSVECKTCLNGTLRVEQFDRVHVSDLAEGETLLQPERIEFGNVEMDPRRAYIEGLELSDGWTDGYRFCISGKDGCRKEAQKKEVKAICEDLGIETSWHKKYIRVHDPEWTTRLARLGKRARFKHAETIGLQEKAAEELLRGLMADSTSNTYGGGRTYSTTSRLMAVQVRLLQRMFGRSTSMKMLTPEQHGGAGKHPMWRVGVRAPGAKSDKVLAVKSIERAVRKVPCWDISTSDHYVYLPEHDVTVSNCDDVTVLLGSLLLSVGIPVMVVKQTFNGGDQEHVLIEAMDDNGNWIPLDPSTDYPAGTKANAIEEFRLDPSSPSTIGLTGAPEAEFISIGATPGFPIWQHRFIGINAFPKPQLPPRLVKRQARRRRMGATTSISTPMSTSGSTSANPYGQALTDLQNQVQTPIKAGDVYLGEKDYAGALTAYQAAGAAGATSVGPEIDLVGAPAYTQPWTQKAWVSNGTLAALGPVQNTDPNAKSIATQAQTLVKGMLANYVSAIQAGQTAFNQGNPGPVPTPAPAWSLTQVVPWMLGAGIVLGVGHAYMDAHKTHAIPLTRKRRRRR